MSHKDIGAISIVYGDDKAGLMHIINKHIGKRKSFETINEFAEFIENAV